MNSTGYLTYVSEMLTTHDAVVIPGFGGFITKYKPARIGEDTGRIDPPTKYIAFNEHLDIHDNTFARFLDEKTSAHYSPRLFDLFTAKLKSDLASNQVIIVPNVGRLYQDYEGTTHFMPDLLNLNNDTFGLPSIDCKKGDWAKSSIGQAARELNNVSLRRAMSSAATVALLFIITLVGIDSFVTSDSGAAELSIIDAISKEETKAPIEEKSTPSIGQEKISDAVPAIIEETIEEPTKEKAIIIVGAFGNTSNAAKRIGEIEALGYQGYQDKPSRLTRVGVEVQYSSEEELELILSTVKDRITSQAWILK